MRTNGKLHKVLTSGGDAPGMNACIRAVTRGAMGKSAEVVGIRRGYTGIFAREFTELDRPRGSQHHPKRRHHPGEFPL